MGKSFCLSDLDLENKENKSGRDSCSSTFRKSSRRMVQQPLSDIDKSAKNFIEYLNKVKNVGLV